MEGVEPKCSSHRMTIHWLGYLGTALVILAYLPQILHLITERCSAGLSVRAYLMWVTSAVLLLTYAVSLGDGVFIALQTYQLVATTVICFCCKKYEHSLCEDHGGEARLNAGPMAVILHEPPEC